MGLINPKHHPHESNNDRTRKAHVTGLKTCASGIHAHNTVPWDHNNGFHATAMKNVEKASEWNHVQTTQIDSAL